MEPVFIAVSSSAQHTFSKPNQPLITLIEGFGVAGDTHARKRVQHRYLVKLDATKPNLRQVHLIQAELFDELNANEFSVSPGELGENITARGIDLLALPKGTKLQIGAKAVIELTALRNPCIQIDKFQKDMLKAVLDKDEDGHVIRKAGVIGIVLVGGEIHSYDPIVINLPPEPHHWLEYMW